MKYKQDLVNYIGDNLIELVEMHLETWKERYYRKSVQDVLFDLNMNYDFSADIECVEHELGRELTDDEKSYFIGCFCRWVKHVYYKKD